MLCNILYWNIESFVSDVTVNGIKVIPHSLSGVFSYQPLTLLVHVGYPKTYISVESL